MSTKEELVSHIKSWISIDNEIIALQRQMKEFKEQKKILTETLVDVMKTNEIDCFDVKEGKLIYSKSKVKKPINKKTLLSALEVYFRDNQELAQNVGEHILNSREETIKENIRRRIEK
jgi:hypothetical protein